MLIRLDQNDPTPIYAQIVNEIRRGLVIGALSPADPLPSARQLAKELRVNSNTVNQAYRELERLGVVEVRRGKGTYVALHGTDATQRAEVVRDVALRALRDARRNGISTDDLVDGIRRFDGQTPAKEEV